MKPSPSLLIAILSAIAVGALATGWLWLRQPSLPEGLIQANGRIEGDHYVVAGKTPGKIAELLAREGDRVAQGQVLLRLDDAQVRAKVDQARQAVVALSSKLKAAQTALAISRKEVPLVIQGAEAELAHAHAQRALARASEEQAARDAARFKKLAESGTVDRRRYEQMELASQVARSQAQSTLEGVRSAEHQLEQARLGHERLSAKRDEMAALAAQRAQAKAALAEAQSVQQDLTLRAPAAGVITQRLGACRT